MENVKIKRKAYGSVQECFRQSYTYSISTEDAEKIGKAAGIIALDVERKRNGFEFMLSCSEQEAKKIVLEKSDIEVEFYG